MKKEKIFIAMLLCCSFLLMSCSGQEEKILIEQPERESQPVLPEEASENGISEETHSRKTIWVDVCGAVKHPGVYELEEGSRVFEAVRAAGGFLEDADSKWLNQAAPAEDGTKIMIYTREEAEKMEEQGAVFKETGSEEEKTLPEK